MAPKRKHTKQSILDGSFDFVREKGFENISARSVAKYINASTAPIYSNFKSMDDLEELLEEKAVETLKASLVENVEDTESILNFPLKYIEFAINDSNLFNQISKSKQSINVLKGHLKDKVYTRMKEIMSNSELLKNLDEEKLDDIIIKTWLHSHGIATFLDRSSSKEDNLNYAKSLLEDSLYTTIYAIKNNYPKIGL